MRSEPHPDGELSNLLWYSQEATCHSDPNYYCEFQRLATPGFIAGIIRELQERRKADSEPVAWTWHYREKWHVTNDEERARDLAWDGVKVVPLYRHAQPAPERDQVRQEHAEWSQATFGDVGPVGPLKHLSKEALEAAAEPGDLSEWADMQFLLWDAQRRAGITDAQITQAMIDKLAVNKGREWPEPKDEEPRLHINKQSALVLPEEITLEKVAEMTAARGAEYSIRDGIIAAKWWNACRAAMLQAVTLTNEGNIQAEPQNAQQNIPEIIPGWIPVSDRMPGNGVQVLVSDVSGHVFVCHHDGSFWVDFRVGIGKRCITHWMPLPAAPQEVKDGK
ncbi:TPA: DUF550 domain-containing protein [Klebsiella variicola subsp. variicola]|nr:DUF550 domain-containing protein [Klebsiella variicola subsp. variicola]